MSCLIFQQLNPIWIQQFLFDETCFMWSYTQFGLIDQQLGSIFVLRLGGHFVKMKGI